MSVDLSNFILLSSLDDEDKKGGSVIKAIFSLVKFMFLAIAISTIILIVIILYILHQQGMLST
ncbi:MAG: hypothetical protein DWQ05_12060 [Calditrichaeota bacterium]|nr:MAG: hypothetical protein DWQ05_12060 [Calditrichota bacterium]